VFQSLADPDDVDRAALLIALRCVPRRRPCRHLRPPADNPQLVPLLDDYAAACKQQGASGRDFRLLGDKAYSHSRTRTELRSRRIKHTIPQRSDQIARRNAKGSTGGGPPAFDAALYGLRNTVERGFNRLKQSRGVATRYDKYALTYLGGILLACAVIHARVGATELGASPRGPRRGYGGRCRRGP
jgi:putative transposase